MEEKYGRVYWKDCIKPELYDSFMENVVFGSAGADMIEDLEEFSIQRNDGLEIYVPQKDIEEYIERMKQ